MHSCQVVIDKDDCHVGVKHLKLVSHSILLLSHRTLVRSISFEDRVHDLRCWIAPGGERSGGPVMLHDLELDIGQYGDVLRWGFKALSCKQHVAQLGHSGICFRLHCC